MYFEVGLFGIAVVLALGQAFGEIDVLYLVENAIGNLQRCEMRHAVGVQAGLLAKLAARHGIGTGVGTFPGSLREFHQALANRVAELRDQIEEFAFRGRLQRDDEAGRFLVDDAVDAALAVRALNHVFADAHPLVAIDLAAADRLDLGRAQAFFSDPQ
jgi:hypothetical protein